MALDILLTVFGFLLIAVVLWDAFETVVLPRRVTRQFRLARIFYRFTWMPWAAIGRRTRGGNVRELFLGVYGPLSLIFLLAVWAILLIFGFGMLHRALGSLIAPSGTGNDFGTDLYMSGSSFFTLGLGDVRPDSTISRILVVIEAGAGFGFLALVISYLPVLYQAFSRREANVTLLDSRAGSPPSSGEFLRRLSGRGRDTLPDLLEDWERWSADLLESHLSYPVLAFYRSQHEQESWLAAMTTILDISALIMCGFAGDAKKTAKLTFAMTRHAAVDLSQIFHTDPRLPYEDRLPPQDFMQLRSDLGHAEHPLDADAEAQLKELRVLYEPYVAALSRYLLMPLPGWMAAQRPDNWQSSRWDLPG